MKEKLGNLIGGFMSILISNSVMGFFFSGKKESELEKELSNLEELKIRYENSKKLFYRRKVRKLNKHIAVLKEKVKLEKLVGEL